MPRGEWRRGEGRCVLLLALTHFWRQWSLGSSCTRRFCWLSWKSFVSSLASSGHSFPSHRRRRHRRHRSLVTVRRSPPRCAGRRLSCGSAAAPKMAGRPPARHHPTLPRWTWKKKEDFRQLCLHDSETCGCKNSSISNSQSPNGKKWRCWSK